MNLRYLATPLLATGLLLSTLGCSKKEEAKPAAMLPGTWTAGDEIQFYYDKNMKQVASNTITGVGDRTIIDDKLITYYYRPGYTLQSAGATYTRDGDTLRIRWAANGPVRAYKVQELTDQKLTLRSRRAVLTPVVHYTTGDALYVIDELQYAR